MSIVRGEGLTGQNHEEPGDVEDIGWEAGPYVVHVVLLARLVLYHIEEDIDGGV